jgi:hypothetical protein
MSKRFRSACLAVALGLAAGSCPVVLAKPPDLPQPQQITVSADPPAAPVEIPATLDTITPCMFLAQQRVNSTFPASQQPERLEVMPVEEPRGRIVLGLGVQSDGRLIVHFEKKTASAKETGTGFTLPLLGMPGGLGAVLGASWGNGAAAPTQCPYLQKQQSQARPVSRPVIEPNDVLANLDKLIRSRQLYETGESYQRQGHPETAAKYYQEAHLVCPACRYGVQAMQRLCKLDEYICRSAAACADSRLSAMMRERMLGDVRVEATAEEVETLGMTGIGWGEVVRLLGCCADVSFGSATRIQCEVPLGAMRIRVQYNSQRDGQPSVRIGIPPSKD